MRDGLGRTVNYLRLSITDRTTDIAKLIGI